MEKEITHRVMKSFEAELDRVNFENLRLRGVEQECLNLYSKLAAAEKEITDLERRNKRQCETIIKYIRYDEQLKRTLDSKPF